MGLKEMITALLVLLTSGCAAGRGGLAPDDEKVRTFAAIYRQSKADRADERLPEPALRLVPDAGYDTPYVPVHEPGRVAKVWIPVHVADEDKDVLVAGHWTFVMVERPHWYVEEHDPPREMP